MDAADEHDQQIPDDDGEPDRATPPNEELLSLSHVAEEIEVVETVEPDPTRPSAGERTVVRTTSRCTCGWEKVTEAGDRTRASLKASGARAAHMTDVRREAKARARAAARAAKPPKFGTRRYRQQVHGALLGEALATDDDRWTRTITCHCGWRDDVVRRSPGRAESAAVRLHRRHVDEQVGRTPWTDALVLLLVTLLACGLLALVVMTAISRSNVLG
ncbi:MAG: hypothetical protein CMH83_07770 [Nocardioides sp.]|nr:hypothetical protein [Nocardioides sp.]